MMSGAVGGAGLAAVRERVRAGVAAVAAEAELAGMARTEVRGQLIRPLVSYAAMAGADGAAPSARFWNGVLAVQMAHEASLVHDDIVDGAMVRRGEPTVVAAGGVARALVHGDHLLTTAYRLAAATGSVEFMTLFARAVERTVAGEIEQGRRIGAPLDRYRYEEIALGKAGELLGCALAVAPLVERRTDAADYFEIGRRLGLLYQRVDDLLDYCPGADTGKPALGDFAQKRWTWPLGELDGDPFSRSIEEITEAFRHAPAGGPSALERCVRRVEEEAARLLADARVLLPGDEILRALVEEWLGRARTAVRGDPAGARGDGLTVIVAAPGGVSAELAARVPLQGDALAYLAANSRSFRFAARLLPAAERGRVARVYAYCRVTDDLVDRPGEAAALLEEWAELSRRAYHDAPTGIGLLDGVMIEMRSAGVPFHYAGELIEGMRMDLGGQRYETLADLRTYTYRVASVVGLWLTRLAGVHDPRVLEQAARLGHAMQLTNILRDVGEDRERGRLYLPAELLRRHGVDDDALDAMQHGGEPIALAYRAAVEELMALAEADYAGAFGAIRALPRWFQPPVAVAGHVYRGIHGSIRRSGYDNLRRRAHTTASEKGTLAARALWELRWSRGTRDGRRLAALPAPLPVAPRVR